MKSAKDQKSSLGDLRKDSQTKTFPIYVALRFKPTLGSLLINYPGPIQKLLAFPLSFTQTTAAFKDPAQRGAFQGSVEGKPVQHLVRLLKGIYLLGAGEMPSRTQRALDTMGFTD